MRPRRVLLALAAVSAAAAAADPPTQRIQEGPSGHTVACALVDQPGMANCADLPAARACAREPELASQSSQQATAMTFVNRSDQAVAIYWLDFQGNRRLYHTLVPGGRFTQATFIGHNWLIATSDGQWVGIFKAAPESLAFF
jgi:invasion protein IalB